MGFLLDFPTERRLSVQGRRLAIALALTMITATPAGADGTEVPESPPFLGPAIVRCAFQNCSSGTYHRWPAVDFRLAPGTPVRATGPGVVVVVDEEVEGDGDPDGCPAETAYCGRPGRFVAIEHADGPYSVYKHLSASVVEVGERVERGQVIGVVGSTQATNIHLHYDEQAALDRFNMAGNWEPIGPMVFWLDKEERSAPTYWGGDDDWFMPAGTPVRSQGWFTAARVVSSGLEFRRTLAELSVSAAEGPFVVRFSRDVTLSGAQVTYSGDELLVLLGGGHVLTSGRDHRALFSTGPLEVNHLRLKPRGWHSRLGRMVRALDRVTTVGIADRRVSLVSSAVGVTSVP
jgi:hypothetical protein